MDNLPAEFTYEEGQDSLPGEFYYEDGDPNTPAPMSDTAPGGAETSTWLGRAATGAADPIFGASQLLQESFPPLQKAAEASDKWLYDKTGGVLGKYAGIKQYLRDRDRNYKAALPADEGFDEARMLGNVATGMLGTKGVSPSTWVGAAGMGGGLALAEPVTEGNDYWMDKAKQVAKGTAGGIVGQKVGDSIGHFFSPAISNEARKMVEEGVELTPGHLAGGTLNSVEQKATSIPFVGEAIERARAKSHYQWNTSVLNDVVESIPHVVKNPIKGAGYDSVGTAQKYVDDAYDYARNLSKGFRIDGEAIGDMQRLRHMAAMLPEDEARRFGKFFTERVHKRIKEGGITSETYKQLDSELYRLVQKTKQLEVGDAFLELKRIMQSAAGRENPPLAKAFKDADRAYAKIQTVNDAVTRATTREGVFSPAQLAMASRKADKTSGKNRSARGEALLQKPSRDAQKVIGDVVPDSGTTGRRLTAGILGAGGAGAQEFATVGATAAGLWGLSKIADNPAAQRAVRNYMMNAPLSKLAEVIDFDKLGVLMGSEVMSD